MALLLGDLEKGCAPAIRLVGARISGRLDVMAAVISHALVLSRCRLDEAPRFVEATTRTVRISDCHLPGFDGSRMRTEGILDFHRSVIEEQLCLDRAQVIGLVRLRGAAVGDGTGEAVAATGLIVDGDMECDAGFTARGQVRLQGARIAGQLTFQNAVLDGTGTALYLTRLQADELRLLTARPIRAQSGSRKPGSLYSTTTLPSGQPKYGSTGSPTMSSVTAPGVSPSPNVSTGSAAAPSDTSLSLMSSWPTSTGAQGTTMTSAACSLPSNGTGGPRSAPPAGPLGGCLM